MGGERLSSIPLDYTIVYALKTTAGTLTRTLAEYIGGLA